MRAVGSFVVVATVVSQSAAFAPVSRNNARAPTQVAATPDRREAVTNIAKLLGGAIVSSAAEPAFAASNPALGGWRSKSKGGGDGTFKPGKGMKSHESFDELMAASNPALGGWRSKKKGGGDGTFKPGKGMKSHESYDELMAASNPALGGWRSKSKGGGDGTFKPGKGMRARVSFDELA